MSKKREADDIVSAKYTLVIIPQWPHLSVAERAWLLKHPLTARPERQAQAEQRAKVERKVIGYARVKQEKRFGGGVNREYEVVQAGTILEVLAPDSRDETDQKFQERIDPKKRWVVLRWQKRAVLLFAHDIERVERVEFERYWKEHTDESHS